MLYALFNMKSESSYRPVYKLNDDWWQRLEKEANINVLKIKFIKK